MTRCRLLARIVVASTGSRDALLLHALDLGATVVIWIDPDGGWIEGYGRPRDGRYRWRGVTWPHAPPLVVDVGVDAGADEGAGEEDGAEVAADVRAS